MSEQAQEADKLPFKKMFLQLVRVLLRKKSVDDVLAALNEALCELGLGKDEGMKIAIGDIVRDLLDSRIAAFNPDRHGDGPLKAIEKVAHELQRGVRRQ
jgi:hypothetical protein